MDRVKQAKRAFDEIRADFGEEKSNRFIARRLGLKSSGDITWLLRHGHLSEALEKALVAKGLLEPRPRAVPVFPCKECGEVHMVEWCVHVDGDPVKRRTESPRKRLPRFSVAAYDARLAMQQLEKYYPGKFVLLEQ